MCSYREANTDITSERQEEARRGDGHCAAKMSVTLTAVDKIACSLGALNHMHAQASLSWRLGTDLFCMVYSFSEIFSHS